jgi:hypothetical protein
MALAALAGQAVFGAWAVLGEGTKRGYVRCRCVCGTEKECYVYNLKHKKTTNCGCKKPEALAAAKRTHGMTDTPEYRVWQHVITRCYNPNADKYEYYGGRGISVCARWRESFSAFLEDMGPRPSPKHQLDRKDNDGNYEKANCRWATRIEQANNKRSNHLLTLDGRTQSVASWGRELGISGRTIITRLRRGWTVDRALKAGTF